MEVKRSESIVSSCSFGREKEGGKRREGRRKVSSRGRSSAITSFSDRLLLLPEEKFLSREGSTGAFPIRDQFLGIEDSKLTSFSSSSSHSETGACLEYLLKNDVLSTLERISENDRPMGIRAEVLNAFNLLVALLDEKFLVHNAVSLRFPSSPRHRLSASLTFSFTAGPSSSSTLTSIMCGRRA